MLVKDRMTRHPIMISTNIPAQEAQKIMVENKIRHLPVTGDGKRLVGLITRQCLSLKTDMLGSLNMWEISRYLSNLTVKKVMIPAKKVYTISPKRTIERAARYLETNQIGCLPVIEDNIVIGMLTKADVLHAYQEMLGLPVAGVRVTIRMPNRFGEFNKLMTVLGNQEWGLMGIGTYPSPRCENCYDAVLKIPNVSMQEVQTVLSQIPEQELIDIRETLPADGTTIRMLS